MKIKDLTTPKNQCFVPTYILEKGKWVETNPNKQNWLKDEIWKSHVGYITKISDEFIVVEFCAGEFQEGVYKGTLIV